MTWLPKPKHVVVIKEPVMEGMKGVNGIVAYRGVTQRFGDAIVLTPQASEETAIHEILHSLGLASEFLVDRLAKALTLKARLLPGFKSTLLQRPKYELCTGCEEFRILHEKYGNKALHYRRR